MSTLDIIPDKFLETILYKGNKYNEGTIELMIH